MRLSTHEDWVALKTLCKLQELKSLYSMYSVIWNQWRSGKTEFSRDIKVVASKWGKGCDHEREEMGNREWWWWKTGVKRGTWMWADAQRDGRHSRILYMGSALCESSVIPFFVPRREVWLTLAAGVLCSNAANIGERKTWTQSEFCTWQNSVIGQESPKWIHSVSTQETTKHRAKFG